MSPPTPPTPPPTDRELRESQLIDHDLRTTGRSLAHERKVRLDRDERLGRASTARPLPCPCALGGLWAGVPRARRRHAVLCALWTPPTASEHRR